MPRRHRRAKTDAIDRERLHRLVTCFRASTPPTRVLLVEDDEADIILTQRALEKANIWNTVDVVRNGQEALDRLAELTCS